MSTIWTDSPWRGR